MAEVVLNNCSITLDEVDYSGQNTNAAISMSAEALDATAMGANTKKNIGGIKDWSMSFEFVADESTVGSLFDKVGTVIPVAVRASAEAVGATNPSYEGNGLITEFSPLDGTVGDLQKVTLTVVASGDLSRVTSAV